MGLQQPDGLRVPPVPHRNQGVAAGKPCPCWELGISPLGKQGCDSGEHRMGTLPWGPPQGPEGQHRVWVWVWGSLGALGRGDRPLCDPSPAARAPSHVHRGAALPVQGRARAVLLAQGCPLPWQRVPGPTEVPGGKCGHLWLPLCAWCATGRMERVPMEAGPAVLGIACKWPCSVSTGHQDPCAGAGPARAGSSPAVCTELCPSCARAGSWKCSAAPLQPCPSQPCSALCLYRVFCPIYLPQMSSPLPTACNTPQKIINGGRLCKQSLSAELFEM